jgi:hypothetical protein
MPVRFSQSPAFAGIVSGSIEDRPENGTGAPAAFRLEDDGAALRTQRQRDRMRAQGEVLQAILGSRPA